MVFFVFAFLWCFCGGVFAFLWWCGGVFVVVWWCFFVVVWWRFCGGVVVFLWWCGGVFVVVFLWHTWCSHMLLTHRVVT